MMRNKSQIVIKDQGKMMKDYYEMKKKQDRLLSKQVISMKSMEHAGF